MPRRFPCRNLMFAHNRPRQLYKLALEGPDYGIGRIYRRNVTLSRIRTGTKRGYSIECGARNESCWEWRAAHGAWRLSYAGVVRFLRAVR